MRNAGKSAALRVPTSRDALTGINRGKAVEVDNELLL